MNNTFRIDNYNLFIIAIIFLLFSCAEQRLPSGGVKDISPPVAKKMVPENNSTNFHYNKIEITFDEFIQFNPNGGNIIISPSLDKKPEFKLVGKKIRITFQEMLENNTTYIINFGNSIKDYNEGNELKNFKYIFSTGSYIDSLSVSGKVLDVFNNEPVKDILVGLYSVSEDSFLYKKPTYLIKTNEIGEYSINNIKVGKYKIAALDDKNLNFIFDQETEMVGFNIENISLNENLEMSPIFLFNSTIESKIKNYSNKEPNHIVFNFTKPFLDLSLDISTFNKENVFYYSNDKKQFHYYYINTDTIKTFFYFLINNSLLDTISLHLLNNKTEDKLIFNTETNIRNDKNLIILDFKYPISIFNKDFFSINNSYKLIENYTWKNNNKTLEILTKTINDTLIINTKDNCFVSFHKLNSKSHSDTIYNFNENVSSLSIIINYKKDLVTELYNENLELQETQIVSRETIVFNNLKKGNYTIRIYEDSNKDGIWNSGNFHRKEQSEKTLFYKKIEIKNNWDNELKIEI